jgi:hypothetical protein
MLTEIFGNDRKGADAARRVRTALVTYDFDAEEERDAPMRALESPTARRALCIALEGMGHMRRQGSVIAASARQLWMGDQHEDPDVHHAHQLEAYERKVAECLAAGLPLPDPPQRKKHPHCPKARVGEGSLAAKYGVCPKTVRRMVDMLQDALLRVYQPPKGAKGSVEATRPKRRGSNGRRTYARWEFLGKPCPRVMARLQAQWGERRFSRAVGMRDEADRCEERLLDCHEAERQRLRDARRRMREALEQPPAQGPPLADGFPLEPPPLDELLKEVQEHQKNPRRR